MAEIGAGIEDLVKSMSEIKRLGEENLANVQVLEGDLGQFRTIDVSALKSGDGQSLIVWNEERKLIPPRPAKPESLPETESLHWYDFEYAGWNVAKRDLPPSNADGAKGKRIVSVNPVFHPYYLAHNRGMKLTAEHFGIELTCYPLPRKDSDLVQAQQIAQAIKERPDLIVFAANDVGASVELIGKVAAAGIPIIAATSMPAAETFPRLIGYTGTDEWGAFRQLARGLADSLGKSGGYGIIQHVPGSGPFYARTWASVTELAAYAPAMECLEKAYTEFDRAKTKAAVQEWIRKHGARLRGIVSADQGLALQGIVDAIEESGEERHRRSRPGALPDLPRPGQGRQGPGHDLPARRDGRRPSDSHGRGLLQRHRLRPGEIPAQQADHERERRGVLPGAMVRGAQDRIVIESAFARAPRGL